MSLFFGRQDTLKGLLALFRELNQASFSFSPFQALALALPLLPRCTFSSYQKLGNLPILAFSLWIAIATHRQYAYNMVSVSLLAYIERCSNSECQPQPS